MKRRYVVLSKIRTPLMMEKFNWQFWRAVADGNCKKHDGDRCEPTRTPMCERCAIRRTPVCAHMEDGHRCAIGVRLIISGVRLVSVWCATEPSWCATEASFWERLHRTHRFHMQQVNPMRLMRPICRANLHKSEVANLTTCGAHQYHLAHTRRKPPSALVSDQVEDPKKFLLSEVSNRYHTENLAV